MKATWLFIVFFERGLCPGDETRILENIAESIFRELELEMWLIRYLQSSFDTPKNMHTKHLYSTLQKTYFSLSGKVNSFVWFGKPYGLLELNLDFSEMKNHFHQIIPVLKKVQGINILITWKWYI